MDADNVDYDELKNIIKIHTTKNQNQAITIPGHEDVQFQQFEELFYEELSNQHDRVDLFVKSKVNEINSRLRKYPCISTPLFPKIKTKNKKLVNLQRQVFRLISKYVLDKKKKDTLDSRCCDKFIRCERHIER